MATATVDLKTCDREQLRAEALRAITDYLVHPGPVRSAFVGRVREVYESAAARGWLASFDAAWKQAEERLEDDEERGPYRPSCSKCGGRGECRHCEAECVHCNGTGIEP